MAINDYALSCATDQVPGYFTYEGNCMIILESKASAIIDKNDFINIEGFMPSLISHESIHVVITTLENGTTSESLDNLEVIVIRGGQRFQIGLNNIYFSSDHTGLVLE